VAVHLGFYVKAEDESIWTLPEILPFVIFWLVNYTEFI
jgi:hypothetical protein